MWTRRMLKEKAKLNLANNYWQAFVVALVLMFIGAISITGPFGSSGGSGSNHSNNTSSNVISSDVGAGTFGSDIQGFVKNQLPLGNSFDLGIFDSPQAVIGFIIAAIIGASLFFFALFLVWRVFLGYPLEIGGRRYFLDLSNGSQNYMSLTTFFNNGSYWNIVKVMFMRALYNFLWYLLLIIPGIIKSYAYAMVPYILAESPDMDYREAIQRSMDMTNGHKLNMFILDLSFIGWYLLGLLLCGLGGVFVNPYYLSTHAELYITIKGDPDYHTV